MIEDHPLRIARIRAGLSAEALAERAGVTRGTVNAIEQGRIKAPRPSYFEVLGKANRLDPNMLRAYYRGWRLAFEKQSDQMPEQVQAQLSPRARAVLALTPEQVLRYPSFKAWRRDVYPSVAGFASMLMLSATSLRRFEEGDISMPKPLISGIQKGLRLGDEYMEALRVLGEAEESVRRTEFFRRQNRIRAVQAYEERHGEIVLDQGEPVGDAAGEVPGAEGVAGGASGDVEVRDEAAAGSGAVR